MGLDIRVPIGWLFTILGGLLSIFGLINNHPTYTGPPVTNINLVWGAALLVFGVLMLVLSKRAMAVARSKTKPASGQRAN
jgi:hypothetical protein